jgi:hypothetical protein
LSHYADRDVLCYLLVLIVTLHTFNCEQELNSTCSRSFLDQHTR